MKNIQAPTPRKSEIRRSKSERNPKAETRRPNSKNSGLTTTARGYWPDTTFVSWLLRLGHFLFLWLCWGDFDRWFLFTFGFFHRLLLGLGLLNALPQGGHDIHDGFFFFGHRDHLFSGNLRLNHFAQRVAVVIGEVQVF